jgi:hypothetical protein
MVVGYLWYRLKYNFSKILHQENFKEKIILERYNNNFHTIINKIISKNSDFL